VNGPQLVNNSGNTVYPIDAPACLLPSGNVLCCGGGSPPCNYPPPTMFFEYQPLTGAIGSLSQVPSPDSAGSTACYQYRVLLLPNGQVIVSNGSNQLEVYTPEGQPEPEWAPAITSLPQAIRQGISEKVVGTQLNGLSQACSYGDDATMATNYPLVRINFSTGIVAYARTANHSTMAVATGTAPQYTYFTVPAGVVDPRTAGLANVSVVANGIMSNPVQATILYSVRTNLINDESFQNDPIPLNGKGLSSLVNPDYAPLQSGSPISVRMLMYLVDAYNAKLPWWRPSAGGFPA